MFKRYFKKLKKIKGIAIVEAMVSLSILVVAMGGIMSLVSGSLSLNRVITDQYVGSYLAAEGVEIVKNLLDANKVQGNPWDQGFPGGPTVDLSLDYQTVLVAPCGGPPPYGPCVDFNQNLFFNSLTGLYYYDRTGPPPDPLVHRFDRMVRINRLTPEEFQVISRVDWISRGGGTFFLEVYDHFFDWRP